MVKVKRIDVWEGAVSARLANYGMNNETEYTVVSLIRQSLKKRLGEKRCGVLDKYAEKLWNEAKENM